MLPATTDSSTRLPVARPAAGPWPPNAPGSFPQARARADPDISAPASPFYASSRLVAALARPPAREVPGVRFVLRPDFDVTPETGASPGAGWAGGIAESDPAVPGSDQGRYLVLVVEPAKAEYRLMAARLPGTEVIRIRPGELSDPPAGINPLEPAPGPDGARFPLQTHADLVRCWSMTSTVIGSCSAS